MIAKLKSQVFIDTLVFDLNGATDSKLDAILSDEKGNICNRLETIVPLNHKTYYWVGHNDLPYGTYTLELFSSDNKKISLSLIKRI